MGALLGRLELPVLADLELEWDDWNVEAYPERPHDLYAGEPLLVVARHRASAPAVAVSGRLGDEPFSRYLGDVNGQVFVFFILTVAAAEAAIGLAILVSLFRNRATINVAEFDSLSG